MQRTSEEYENYEPEVYVWPYVLLGFIVPLVPFLSFILMKQHGMVSSENMIWSILNMFPIALLYFVTAYAVRTANGSVLYIFIGMLYFFIELFHWGGIGGSTLYPLGVIISPAFLAPLAYAYYAKRKRLPAWAAVLLLSALSEALVILYIASAVKPAGIYGAVCYGFPALVILVSLLTSAVTRRMENTPWFIMIPLSFLTVLSLLMSDRSASAMSDVRSFLIYILIETVSGFPFWYMVSVIIAYQGLSRKSYFRNIGIDFSQNSNIDYKEEKVPGEFFPEGYKEQQPRTASINPDECRTAYPPRMSRFDKPDSNGQASGRSDCYVDDVIDRGYQRESDSAPRRKYREPDYYDDDGYYDRRPRPRYDEDRNDHPRRRYDDSYDRDNRYYDDYDRPRRRPSAEMDESRRRPVRDLDYEDDPRSQYDRWYDLIKGDDSEDSERRRR